MTRFVTRYVVTGVRRGLSADGSHSHITGVYAGGAYFPREQLVRSIQLRNEWVVRMADELVPVRVTDACPYRNCTESPYVRSISPEPGTDVLDLLPNPGLAS
ncbi:MAG: hypothetical protein ACYC3W_01550 [Candidatus Nanopelagicales bacterium]